MSTKTFQEACETLWGPQYQSAAARKLGIARSSLVRYDRGDRAVPPAVLDRLYGLMIKRQAEVTKLVAKLAEARRGQS
jgi:hypothetical protein